MFPANSFDPYYGARPRSPEDYLRRLHIWTQDLGTEDHKLCVNVNKHSMMENSISPSGIQHPSHIAYYAPDVFALPRTYTEMPQNFAQPSMPSILRAAEWSDGFMANFAACSTYDLVNGTCCGDHLTFDPSDATLWGDSSSSGQPLVSLVAREAREPGDHLHNDSIPHPSLADSLYETPSRYSNFTNALIVANAVASDDILPAHLQLESQPKFPIYRPPPQGSAGPFRRRASCAIEYSGIWIDQDELLNGLGEPSGKICVMECRWAQDLSPCSLWVKGDKSSINAHIQKWHAGKPEGDKFQVDCRWHGCGKTMHKDSIARHVVGIHLGEVWECQGCGKKIVRNDAYGLHAMKSKINACQTSGALITYSVGIQEIDVRAALDSGGRLRYVNA